MLAGIKFIPRDRLQSAKHESDSSSDDREVEEKQKKSTRGNKEKHDSRRSGRSKSLYEDADGEKKRSEKRRKKKKSKRSKKSSKNRYSSDDVSPSSSEGESESLSDNDKATRRRGKKLDRSDSSSGGYEERRSRSRRGSSNKRDKEKKKEIEDSSDDGRDLISQKQHNELSRKEMGLEWMLRSENKAVKEAASKVDDKPEEPQVEEVNKTNPKELNPYLQNNGRGYPESSEAGADVLLTSSVVGDGGASWQLKALKRAKEQAAREGLNFAEVVKERWGSLGHLAASVTNQSPAPVHAHLHAIRNRKRGRTERAETVTCSELKGGTEAVGLHSQEYLKDVSSHHPEMKKPKHDSLSWKKKKGHSLEATSLIADAVSASSKFANDGSFMENFLRLQSEGAGIANSPTATVMENNDRNNKLISHNVDEPCELNFANDQMASSNKMAAKVLQLRMKGKHEEAEYLSKKMETLIQKHDAGAQVIRQENNKSSSRYIDRSISNEHKKREEDADLHLAQKIMSNRGYSLSGRADDEYDFDGEPTRKRHRKREGMPSEKRAVSNRFLTQQERCQFCFENPSRPKHLVISIANFTYMMIPLWQPVVEGHCCVLPMQHEFSTRTIDNNVWEEVRNFKKCLIKMFAKQDKDVVFIETVIGLAKQRRHCLVECIPIPGELAEQAPLYFKKAIDEAEDEWGQHEMKKLIQTSGNLRHVIPANFSYFHVEFGLDRGFVHVIEDDNNFRSSFGLNVIRGLLRLPEEDMHRRSRHEPVEKQKQAVARFAREWEPFDWTKQLE